MAFRYAFMAFGLLAAGCVTAAGLSPALRDFNGSEGTSPPAKLSQTGLYQAQKGPGGSRVLGDGIAAFEVNSPLWSDGAAKERFISLPAGSKAVPTDTDSYAFPEGTVFIKNFRLDTLYGDSASSILVETRFLIKHTTADDNGFPWHGVTYKWARDQSDAELASQDLGENAIVNIRQNGALRGKRWTFPSKNQCITCHFGRGILGFITPQLHRPSAGNPAVDQFQDLVARGVLTANPVAGRPGAFRWAGLHETGESLELRARSYFAANCSHCHGNGPPGSSPGDHVFEFYHPEVSVDRGPEGLNGAYIGKNTHQGGDAFPQFIFKGHPESSYVMKRMLVRQDLDFTPTEQMPTLATFQPDSAGLGLLRDWICALGSRPAGSCRLPEVQSDASYWDAPALVGIHGGSPGSRKRPGPILHAPTFRQGILRVTPAILAVGASLRLFDIRGVRIRLVRAGEGEFRTSLPVPAGLYFLRAGSGIYPVYNLRSSPR